MVPLLVVKPSKTPSLIWVVTLKTHSASLTRSRNCMHNVRITRTTGDKIETNQMFYNTSTRRTYGDAFIHIEGGGRVIEGFGYEYWDNDKRYVVRRVQGIFPIDDSRFRPH